MAQSKHRPVIYKQAGKIVIPCNLRIVTQTDSEDGTEQTFYDYQEITLDQANAPDLNGVKEVIAKQLESELREYIYNEYDAGIQQTISALAFKASRLGRDDIVGEYEAIFGWIQQVLDYYDRLLQGIRSMATADDAMDVNWDFEANVPKSADLKGWREIKASLER